MSFCVFVYLLRIKHRSPNGQLLVWILIWVIPDVIPSHRQDGIHRVDTQYIYIYIFQDPPSIHTTVIHHIDIYNSARTIYIQYPTQVAQPSMYIIYIPNLHDISIISIKSTIHFLLTFESSRRSVESFPDFWGMPPSCIWGIGDIPCADSERRLSANSKRRGSCFRVSFLGEGLGGDDWFHGEDFVYRFGDVLMF